MNSENNKLIAEFLGWNVNNPSTFPTELHQEEEIQGFWELRFDKDWNWLMKAVEKIENSQANFEIKSHWSAFVEANIYQTTIKVFEYTKMHTAYSSEEIVTIYTNPNRNKLENVYEGVVKFIEWYNKK